MDEYYSRVNNNALDTIFNEWKGLCITIHKKVKVSQRGKDIVGFVEDISREGALILDTSTGKKTIYTGDVTLLEG